MENHVLTTTVELTNHLVDQLDKTKVDTKEVMDTIHVLIETLEMGVLAQECSLLFLLYTIDTVTTILATNPKTSTQKIKNHEDLILINQGSILKDPLKFTIRFLKKVVLKKRNPKQNPEAHKKAMDDINFLSKIYNYLNERLKVDKKLQTNFDDTQELTEKVAKIITDISTVLVFIVENIDDNLVTVNYILNKTIRELWEIPIINMVCFQYSLTLAEDQTQEENKETEED